jgi:AraC-like DNA-binding protein
VRWFHTCQQPKEHRAAIWPDRKLQCIIYMMPTFLLPYAIEPSDPSAWLMYKSYFPACYYFYSATLLLCFFGSLRQWGQWKTVSWIGAIITSLTMAPLVLNAWVPDGFMTEGAISLWNNVVMVVSVVMMVYAVLAMWQVWQWMNESRDVNYSNPDDFPSEYAHRVWLTPIILTPLLWPPFITDSPKVMAVMVIIQSVFNIVLLLMVMPVWRRAAILSDVIEEDEMEVVTDPHDELAEERTSRIAAEIEQFVNTEAAYLDPHLKLEQVVERCSFSRSYVSRVFTERFGGFSDYVNGLRLEYFNHYMTRHPNSTAEAAAEASGFTSYRAYHRAKERLNAQK